MPRSYRYIHLDVFTEQTVSCGVPFLFVPLTTRRAVDNAALDAPAYDAFRRAAGLDELPVFLFSPESAGDQATVYSRMFAPGFGITAAKARYIFDKKGYGPFHHRGGL